MSISLSAQLSYCRIRRKKERPTIRLTQPGAHTSLASVHCNDYDPSNSSAAKTPYGDEHSIPKKGSLVSRHGTIAVAYLQLCSVDRAVVQNYEPTYGLSECDEILGFRTLLWWLCWMFMWVCQLLARLADGTRRTSFSVDKVQMLFEQNSSNQQLHSTSHHSVTVSHSSDYLTEIGHCLRSRSRKVLSWKK